MLVGEDLRVPRREAGGRPMELDRSGRSVTGASSPPGTCRDRSPLRNQHRRYPIGHEIVRGNRSGANPVVLLRPRPGLPVRGLDHVGLGNTAPSAGTVLPVPVTWSPRPWVRIDAGLLRPARPSPHLRDRLVDLDGLCVVLLPELRKRFRTPIFHPQDTHRSVHRATCSDALHPPLCAQNLWTSPVVMAPS